MILETLRAMHGQAAVANYDPRNDGQNLAAAGMHARRGMAELELQRLRRQLGDMVLDKAGIIVMRAAAGKVRRFLALMEDESLVPPVVVSVGALYEHLAAAANAVDVTSDFFSPVHFHVACDSLTSWAILNGHVQYQLAPDLQEVRLAPHGTEARQHTIARTLAKMIRKDNGDRLTWEAIKIEAAKRAEEALADIDEEPAMVPLVLLVPDWMEGELAVPQGAVFVQVGPDDLPARDKISRELVRGYLAQLANKQQTKNDETEANK